MTILATFATLSFEIVFVILNCDQSTSCATIINTTCAVQTTKCCPTSSSDILTTWPIWVGLFCGLLLLSVVLAVHHRWKRRNRVIQLTVNQQQNQDSQTSNFPTQTNYLGRPIFVQPAPENNFYVNFGHYFTTKPPPYSPSTEYAGTVPPPSYTVSSSPTDQLDELWRQSPKDEVSEAMSVIRPMQPAYRVPGSPVDYEQMPITRSNSDSRLVREQSVGHI